ncbi:hypothetical protein FRC10_001258 [Ceratobasidium sp. 414]|nr:hypothetical protein FRC10_001258 [Ceratobasidium sp. 414]
MAERPNFYNTPDDVPPPARYLLNVHSTVNAGEEDLEEAEMFVPRPTQAEGAKVESPKALPNIIAALSSHGCPNASEFLDLGECGDRPVAFGGFGDIYYGKTKDGMPVAIKCARVNIDEIIERSTLKVSTALYQSMCTTDLLYPRQ